MHDFRQGDRMTTPPLSILSIVLLHVLSHQQHLFRSVDSSADRKQIGRVVSRRQLLQHPWLAQVDPIPHGRIGYYFTGLIGHRSNMHHLPFALLIVVSVCWTKHLCTAWPNDTALLLSLKSCARIALAHSDGSCHIF